MWGIFFALHVISPIATHFFVAWCSVVCMWSVFQSYLSTLLKPFDGYRYHLTGTHKVWILRN